MTDFQSRVFEAVKLVPKGKVTTYGAIALYLGIPETSRAVGNALHTNPTPIVIPCHRVVNGQGRLAKHFGFGGSSAQARLLNDKGVIVTDGKVDLSIYGWYFN